ncbi:uncharacterized protein PRCAT00001278001 [Priceomyces carsonii]|uniref:uncharacterized protein n=1 Tax=Priceomyces carsonii TaxID=28549 RepID=UPI002EDAF6C9|nr:unnamed protein product [Priceomyces carsonii]
MAIIEDQDRKNLTLSQRFRLAINDFYHDFKADIRPSERQDSIKFQSKLLHLIKEFQLIKLISENLHLFSDNESIDEISTSYIQFLNVDFYLGSLYLLSLSDPKSGSLEDPIDILEYKEANLNMAKRYFVNFLVLLDGYEILSKQQSARIKSFKETYNPTFDEILLFDNNPARKRAQKIANHREEKELGSKVKMLDKYYDQGEDDANDSFERFDRETIREVFLDQVKLFSMKAFECLENLVMELDVLSRRPNNHTPSENNKLKGEKPTDRDDSGYTTRLESLPFQKKGISDLISKQGKILKPFTITLDRQQLKDKVFGTGQILPSMTVDEYLDYELANGKMASEPIESKINEESDYEDSEEEREQRRWDDWKDDNPKGSGNMKANIG